VKAALVEFVRAIYETRETEFGGDVVRQLEHWVLLQAIDHHWKDHLLGMDHLKEGIGLRGYAQRNPLQEYQREGFDLFEAMMARFEDDAVDKLFAMRPISEEEARSRMAQAEAEQAAVAVEHGASEPGAEIGEGKIGQASTAAPAQPIVTEEERQAFQQRIAAQQVAEQRRMAEKQMVMSHGDRPASQSRQAAPAPEAGRNEPCPCGSGKKYKKCHGRMA
jgi:preprotein translocase subunit SecA